MSSERMVGHQITIDETRSVWVRSDAPDGELWVVFTNGDQKTQLRLSREAGNALVKLMVFEWAGAEVAA